jgi:hypothetical protein
VGDELAQRDAQIGALTERLTALTGSSSEGELDHG